jgi:calcineurin-like phosphoesterase
LSILERLVDWTCTQDSDFLKSFHANGGVPIVLNFLKETMNDAVCKGAVCIECIGKAAHVIVNTIYTGEHGVNKEIVTKIVTSWNAIVLPVNTIIDASAEYGGGCDFWQLHVLWVVWNALLNITAYTDAIKDAFNQDQAIVISSPISSPMIVLSLHIHSDTYLILFRILEYCTL